MIHGTFFYSMAIPAVILFGFSKGGFSGVSMLGTPLIALAVGPTRAAGIVMPILMVQDALGIVLFRRHWNRRLIQTMIPGAAAGVGAAYLFSANVSQALIEIALGAISVIFAALTERRQRIVGPGNTGLLISRPYGVLMGGASGFTSMIAHAGVPPFQLFVANMRLSRDEYIGTSIVFFAATNAMKVVPYAMLGQFTEENLSTSLSLCPLALLATWTGTKLVRRIDPARFYHVINGLLCGIGLVLIIQGIAHLTR